MDSINKVIQLFEYEQLSTLIKFIEKMRQIFVNGPLKSLLDIKSLLGRSLFLVKWQAGSLQQPF